LPTQYKISREDQRLQHASAQQRDGHRYSGLPGVLFSKPVCVASVGRILAGKLTEPPDPPVDAIAFFDRPEMKGRHDEQIYEKGEFGSFVSPAGDRVDISFDGWGEGRRRFPDWKQIVPAENLTDARVICLDAELLYKLAKALIPKNENLVVTLEFSDGDWLAVVRAGEYTDRAGMIAVVRRDPDQFTASQILRAVVAGQRLEPEPPVTAATPPAPTLPDEPDESELILDFSDEELLTLAVALDVINSAS
jgi:hypothetical protein